MSKPSNCDCWYFLTRPPSKWELKQAPVLAERLRCEGWKRGERGCDKGQG